MPQLNVILCATLCVAAIGWRPLAKAPSAPRAIARIGATATDARRTSPDSIQFNADKLQMGAHRYDLVVTLRGEEQTIGWSDVALTRSGDTVRFTEALAWPATGLSQRVEVLFHARSLAVQLHTSDMTSGLQRAHSTVSFVGGRATGRVQQLLPLSVSSREVDLPMDENVTDDAIAVHLLATTQLRPGASGTYRAFRMSKGRIETFRVRVGDRETITVPAGRFEVYPIVVNGRQEMAYVSAAEPHLLIATRIREAGSATSLETRLVR